MWITIDFLIYSPDEFNTRFRAEVFAPKYLQYGAMTFQRRWFMTPKRFRANWKFSLLRMELCHPLDDIACNIFNEFQVRSLNFL